VKQTAERIFRETLAAIDVSAAIERKLARMGSFIRAGTASIDLREFRTIVAIAYGKAADAMARGLAGVLGPEFAPEGILVAPTAPVAELPGWRTFTGEHPLPNEGSFAAGRAILDLLARCDEHTLVFFLISGGGSALVELPLEPGATLDDFRQLHLSLVTCGASIQEINSIRKHLSATKGGRLAARAPRSMKVTLAISDVPQGQESALASGPTLPDPTTIRDAERVVHEYKLMERLPRTIREAFETHSLHETPKVGDAAFARSHFVLLLGPRELLHAAHHACEAEGFVCLCDNAADNWPVPKAVDYLLAQLAAHARANPNRPVAVLCDGELSSPVTGDGIGGRNSAFVLACVEKIAERKITILSAGTDGVDGSSNAAGAVADGQTLGRARETGLDPGDFLRRCDSSTFFARLDDAVVTGPTGNNLRDLRIFLAEPEA
jgi:glycerate 2-kinase